MANYMGADWTPIFDSINNLGNGLVGNALKQAQMRRGYEKALLDRDRTLADIEFTNARTAGQNNKNARATAVWNAVGGALKDLTPNDQKFSALEMGGVNSGRVSSANKTALETQLLESLSKSGPEGLVAAATGNAVMPYSIKDGVLLNRFNGDAQPLPAEVLKAIAPLDSKKSMTQTTPGRASQSEAKNMKLITDLITPFVTSSKEFDNGFGQKTVKPVVDYEALASLVGGMFRAGIDINDPVAVMRFAADQRENSVAAGALKTSVPPISTTPLADEGQGVWETIKNFFPPRSTPAVQGQVPQQTQEPFPGETFSRDQLLSLLERGLITDEQYEMLIDGAN